MHFKRLHDRTDRTNALWKQLKILSMIIDNNRQEAIVSLYQPQAYLEIRSATYSALTN